MDTKGQQKSNDALMWRLLVYHKGPIFFCENLLGTSDKINRFIFSRSPLFFGIKGKLEEEIEFKL